MSEPRAARQVRVKALANGDVALVLEDETGPFAFAHMQRLPAAELAESILATTLPGDSHEPMVQ